jgi:small subunit ribosomal protein S8
MMTDPVADLLTYLRNANTVGKKSISMPASRLKVGVCQVLQEEGFIQSFSVEPGTPRSTLKIELRFGPDGERVLRSIQRVSKPGCRVYSKAADVPSVLRGMGIYVLSTPRGVVSDRTARKINAGGEILCKVS